MASAPSPCRKTTSTQVLEQTTAPSRPVRMRCRLRLRRSNEWVPRTGRTVAHPNNSTTPLTDAEKDLFDDGKQPAFNSTMDLQNNEVGMATNRQVDGLPDRVSIKADLTQKYAAGEMYIWERPPGRDVGQEQSEGIIVKSNLSKIYP